MSRDHLILGNGRLLNEQGILLEPGYALRPPFENRHEGIAASNQEYVFGNASAAGHIHNRC